MNARYQISIASVGSDLEIERGRIVKTVVTMGHLPVDLLEAGVLDSDSSDTMARHVARSDYLVLIVSGKGDKADIEHADRMFEMALDRKVPVLSLVGADGDGPMQEFAKKVRGYPIGMSESLDGVGESAAWILIRLIDTYPRPGWVSSVELPQGGTAAELARLSKENAEVRQRLGEIDPEGEAEEQAKYLSVERALQDNKILIPLWERSSSRWEKPVELTLHQFFIRIAPELAVEMSSAAAAEFVPTGVCELDPEGSRSKWMVPITNINLWLADLMALGLVTPSQQKHHAKDSNQYWALTPDGREFFSRHRRSVLEAGGHRHVGFTSEFPIPGGTGGMH